MSEIKLLPCPFCGAEMIVFEDKQLFGHRLEEEDCILAMHYFSTMDIESIEKWNARKPMQEIVKRLEKKIDNRLYNPNWNAGIIASISVVESVGGING